MTILLKMTPEEFRRHLAGLDDVQGQRGLEPENFRAFGINLVMALAIAFNRRSLNVKTLWTRIDSSIISGLAAANGADLHRLVDAACEHVMALPNAVVSDAFQEFTQPLFEMSGDDAYAFCRYLALSRYTVLAYAKKEWDTRKELRKSANALAKEADESRGVE